MKELNRDKIKQLNTCEIFIGLISTQMQKNSTTGVHYYSQQNFLFFKVGK